MQWPVHRGQCSKAGWPLEGLYLLVIPSHPSGFELGNQRLLEAIEPGLSGMALVYACCPGLFSDRALFLSKWLGVAGESSVSCSDYHVQLAHFPPSLNLSSLYCSCVLSSLASVCPFNFLASFFSDCTLCKMISRTSLCWKNQLGVFIIRFGISWVSDVLFFVYVDNCNPLLGLCDSGFSSSRGTGYICLWEKLDKKVEAMPKSFSFLFALRTFFGH